MNLFASPWWVPFKVLPFLWKLSNDNLPERREFTKRNFINDASCQLCATNEEALDYLLITYELYSQFRIGLLFGWIVYKAQYMSHHFNFIFSNTLWPIGSIETKCCMKQQALMLVKFWVPPFSCFLCEGMQQTHGKWAPIKFQLL